jgi:phosphoribosylformimino-5-aminoimidazole carboxamide ribotide isomerase
LGRDQYSYNGVMRVIPVIDLMHGQVVHGIGGRRHQYQPIRSALTTSTDPLAIAESIRRRFGLTFLYLADLDAIGGNAPSLPTYTNLQKAGFTLLIDAGLRTTADAEPLLEAGVACLVAGLETLDGPDVLAALAKRVGPARLVLSLDMKECQPLAAGRWHDADAIVIARQAVQLGVGRILVLDLARVGTGSGVGTESLCRQLKQTWPAVEVLAGGGVRGPGDLWNLRHRGVDAVLVASALHDGRLRREDLLALYQPEA